MEEKVTYWKYRIIHESAEPILVDLDEAGVEGWELVSVCLSPHSDRYVSFLKRLLRDWERRPSRDWLEWEEYKKNRE